MAKKLGNAIRSEKLRKAINIKMIRYLGKYGFFDATIETTCGRKAVTLTIGSKGEVTDIEFVNLA